MQQEGESNRRTHVEVVHCNDVEQVQIVLETKGFLVPPETNTLKRIGGGRRCGHAEQDTACHSDNMPGSSNHNYPRLIAGALMSGVWPMNKSRQDGWSNLMASFRDFMAQSTLEMLRDWTYTAKSTCVAPR